MKIYYRDFKLHHWPTCWGHHTHGVQCVLYMERLTDPWHLTWSLLSGVRNTVQSWTSSLAGTFMPKCQAFINRAWVLPPVSENDQNTRGHSKNTRSALLQDAASWWIFIRYISTEMMTAIRVRQWLIFAACVLVSHLGIGLVFIRSIHIMVWHPCINQCPIERSSSRNGAPTCTECRYTIVFRPPFLGHKSICTCLPLCC